jgi:RNA polymerase II subunit A small phosphatase-like protein
VLVDDTPLAFLHQPENGVPVLGFRGDPDDRLLMEAVLPLIQVGLVVSSGLVMRAAVII